MASLRMPKSSLGQPERRQSASGTDAVLITASAVRAIVLREVLRIPEDLPAPCLRASCSIGEWRHRHIPRGGSVDPGV